MRRCDSSREVRGDVAADGAWRPCPEAGVGLRRAGKQANGECHRGETRRAWSVGGRDFLGSGRVASEDWFRSRVSLYLRFRLGRFGAAVGLDGWLSRLAISRRWWAGERCVQSRVCLVGIVSCRFASRRVPEPVLPPSRGEGVLVRRPLSVVPCADLGACPLSLPSARWSALPSRRRRGLAVASRWTCCVRASRRGPAVFARRGLPAPCSSHVRVSVNARTARAATAQAQPGYPCGTAVLWCRRERARDRLGVPGTRRWRSRRVAALPRPAAPSVSVHRAPVPAMWHPHRGCGGRKARVFAAAAAAA